VLAAIFEESSDGRTVAGEEGANLSRTHSPDGTPAAATSSSTSAARSAGPPVRAMVWSVVRRARSCAAGGAGGTGPGVWSRVDRDGRGALPFQPRAGARRAAPATPRGLCAEGAAPRRVRGPRAAARAWRRSVHTGVHAHRENRRAAADGPPIGAIVRAMRYSSQCAAACTRSPGSTRPDSGAPRRPCQARRRPRAVADAPGGCRRTPCQARPRCPVLWRVTRWAQCGVDVSRIASMCPYKVPL
jgi:hypothetical protein